MQPDVGPDTCTCGCQDGQPLPAFGHGLRLVAVDGQQVAKHVQKDLRAIYGLPSQADERLEAALAQIDVAEANARTAIFREEALKNGG